MGWNPITQSGTGSGSSKAPQIDFYDTPGTYTWTKPSGAVWVETKCIGGGGGGGSGRRGAVGTIRCAGGAGGSGAMSYLSNSNSTSNPFILPASIIPATVTVTVGTGGTGGAAITTDDTNGLPGNGGGASIFGSFVIAMGAGFGATGQGGAGGTATSGSAGQGGSSSVQVGLSGGAASATGGIGSGGATSLGLGPTSGGAGAGITAANVQTQGGPGGASGWFGINPYGGFYVPGALGTSTNYSTFNQHAGNGPDVGPLLGLPVGGLGGGGGGSRLADVGGNGGNGGKYGGGGGSGSASLNGYVSGKGGNGASGCVQVITYF